MPGCIGGSCGVNSGLMDPTQGRQALGNFASGQGETQVSEQATGGCANGSCGGGAKGGNSMATSSPGCSGGKCGGGSSSGGAESAGGCGAGGCGGGKESAAQGQGGKQGLFKATMMTVAATELAQLTIDYSQYLS